MDSLVCTYSIGHLLRWSLTDLFSVTLMNAVSGARRVWMLVHNTVLTPHLRGLNYDLVGLCCETLRLLANQTRWDELA